MSAEPHTLAVALFRDCPCCNRRVLLDEWRDEFAQSGCWDCNPDVLDGPGLSEALNDPLGEEACHVS